MSPKDLSPWDSGEIDMLAVMNRGMKMGRKRGSRFRNHSGIVRPLSWVRRAILRLREGPIR